jgi:biopolymer transport protein TolR
MAMGPILGSGRRGRRTPMAEINVTPMVDVMLVLLIIFMVTAPLLAAGVQVDLPESKADALQQDREPVAISIDGGGAIFIGDVAVAEQQLPARLREIAGGSREAGGPRVMVRADRSLDYGRVLRLMGELNAAGLRRISLVSNGEPR